MLFSQGTWLATESVGAIHPRSTGPKGASTCAWQLFITDPLLKSKHQLYLSVKVLESLLNYF